MDNKTGSKGVCGIMHEQVMRQTTWREKEQTDGQRGRGSVE